MLKPITLTCAQSGEEFIVDDVEHRFRLEHGLPLPLLSPYERLRRRFASRHGGRLFRAQCAGTGKSVVSMYPASSGFKSMESGYWWSDAWSALDYGRDYDPRRPFFDQIRDLALAVPHISLINTNCENSYYTNHALNCKNCYLLFGAVENQDCQYGYFVRDCKDVFDALSLHKCELCYDGVSSLRCYGCISFSNSRDCHDCIYIEDCNSCSHCIACVGLERESYCVLNRKVGKEEYQRVRESLRLGHRGVSPLAGEFEALRVSASRPASHLYNTERCTGDMLIESKDCIECFDSERCEQCRYCAFSADAFGSFDCTFNAGGGARHSYDSVSTLGSECHFDAIVWFGDNVQYSIECAHSQYLFGCVGLRRAAHCILNKQYTPEEYSRLRARIIDEMRARGDWGEFFPAGHSLYAYNDSIADLYMPLSKGAAAARGYRWNDDLAQEAQGPGIIPPTELEKTPDSIINQALIDEASGKFFKVNAAELEFHRRIGVAIPAHAPETRHRNRIRKRHFFRLFSRVDSGGPKDSIYPPSTQMTLREQ